MQNSNVIITCPECISDLQITKKVFDTPDSKVRCGGCYAVISCSEAYEKKQQNSVIPEAPLANHVAEQANQATDEEVFVEKGERDDDMEHQRLQRKYSQHRSKNKKKNFYIALFCLILLVPLSVQLIWRSDYNLAKQKVIDPALGYVCQVFDLDCSFILTVDENLKLVGDFRFVDDETILFEGNLNNEAGESKKFPRIKLMVSDLSDQELAAGIFGYRGYLNDVVVRDTMDANSSYAVRLAVHFKKRTQQIEKDKIKFTAKLLP